MLSYQHHFHAGNLADVHKHALLAWMLNYMIQKDKPLTYIETHAGRGLYDLGADEAIRTGEAEGGIFVAEQWFSADHPYRQRLAEVRARYGPMAYPGSPMIAALSLRDHDTLHLAELHPQEIAYLRSHMAPWTTHIQPRDGFEMALALTPPTPRRGLMLIDPSYEVKADYDNIPKALAQLHRKWNIGVIALWYPLLTSGTHRNMLKVLEETFPDALHSQVRFPPVRDGHRMEGSGLFIINPPYGTETEAARTEKMFKLLK